MTETIKGFKGFDNDLKCRGYQYEVGQYFQEEGKIEACSKGFHFCENPFDVFSYYPPFTENGINRYCVVEGGGSIDCGTNESLFLAISALRDDTNKNQWFVADSPLSVSYDDIVGNDHYFTESKGSVFFWDINWMHATIISGYYHKATVEELIEHFKGKEK